MKIMRSGLRFCLIVLLIFGLLPSTIWANDENEVENQIVVVYKKSSEGQVRTLALDSLGKSESLSARVDLLELENPEEVEKTIKTLANDPSVLAVERNALVQTALLPDDPYVKDGSAWYFEKIGASQTWDQGVDSQEIVVAVIDTGLYVDHPDLSNRVLQGYDFVTGSKQMTDLSGHGTMVSGCVAAAADNGIGIAGVAGLANVKIRPYRTGGMTPGDRTLYISHIAAAIIEAADQTDVRVINMSFGTYSDSLAIRESINYAVAQGKILVSSSGNEGNTRAGQYGYPASYDQVISVAATDQNDQRPNYSQYNDQVNLAAPGNSIISTNRLGGYGMVNTGSGTSGTSFSAPMVSGACALLLAAKNDLTAPEVQAILEKTALDLGPPGKDPYYGHGRIQLNKAFDYINDTRPLTGISLEPDQISLLKGNEITLRVDYQPADTSDERLVAWTSSNPQVATIDQLGKLSARSLGTAVIQAQVGDFQANCLVTVKAIGSLAVPRYQSHIQNRGWQDWQSDGIISGTTGQSLRLEGLRVGIEEESPQLEVRYRSHVQDQGWENAWSYNGQLSGSVGQSKRLEAVYIELTGVDRQLWDIYYQVHAQNFGWLDWAKNGEPAGTEGLSLRLEGLRVKILPKNDPPPGSLERPFVK